MTPGEPLQPSWPEGFDPSALSPADSAALDALVDAQFDPLVVAPAVRDRAARIASILDLLDPIAPSAPQRDALIAAVVARVSEARHAALEPARSDGWITESNALSSDDRDALDALVAKGFDPARVPVALRARAERHAAILSLLDQAPVEQGERESLIARTLVHIQAGIESERGRMSYSAAAERRVGWNFRWADLLTVASMLLIAGAVLAPMIESMRSGQRRLACTSNLMSAGTGFAAYAADYRDHLPMASASLAGNPWWLVGVPDRSNSSNLFTLPRAGYVPLARLSCPGNVLACDGTMPMAHGQPAQDWAGLGQVSYSMQNLFARERRNWVGGPGSTQRVEMLVDRSPVVLRAVRREVIFPMENSPNHRGEGQTVLFNDGAAEWITSPVSVRGDNLWLPRSIEQMLVRFAEPNRARPLDGNEEPASLEDSFMVP